MLDYDDTVRDASAPYAFSFGSGMPGEVREVGTPTSGQATPGAAFQVTRSADTDTVLMVSLSDFTSGGSTIPAGSVAWRANGSSGAWTPFTTTSAAIDASAAPPGPLVRSYDVRVTLPGAAAVGAYAGTMTWTVVATP